MREGKITEQVRKLALPVTAAANLELVDVEYVREGGSWYLRLYIDKPGGIGVEDCSLVSRQMSDILDEADPIPGAYHLEVSSPGLDRPLKTEADFRRFTGEMVEVHTYKPVGGKKVHVGQLMEYRAEAVDLGAADGQVQSFPRAEVAQVRLYVDFQAGR